MIRSMANLLRVDPGFHAAHVLSQRVQLPPMRYPAERQVREFCNRLLDSAAALPGVTAAAISTSLPMHDTLSLAPYRLANQPDPRPGERTMADFKGVSEDYFAAIGATLLRGRFFTKQDAMAESPQVAILNMLWRASCRALAIRWAVRSWWGPAQRLSWASLPGRAKQASMGRSAPRYFYPRARSLQ